MRRWISIVLAFSLGVPPQSWGGPPGTADGARAAVREAALIPAAALVRAGGRPAILVIGWWSSTVHAAAAPQDPSWPLAPGLSTISWTPLVAMAGLIAAAFLNARPTRADQIRFLYPTVAPPLSIFTTTEADHLRRLMSGEKVRFSSESSVRYVHEGNILEKIERYARVREAKAQGMEAVRALPVSALVFTSKRVPLRLAQAGKKSVHDLESLTRDELRRTGGGQATRNEVIRVLQDLGLSSALTVNGVSRELETSPSEEAEGRDMPPLTLGDFFETLRAHFDDRWFRIEEAVVLTPRSASAIRARLHLLQQLLLLDLDSSRKGSAGQPQFRYRIPDSLRAAMANEPSTYDRLLVHAALTAETLPSPDLVRDARAFVRQFRGTALDFSTRRRGSPPLPIRPAAAPPWIARLEEAAKPFNDAVTRYYKLGTANSSSAALDRDVRVLLLEQSRLRAELTELQSPALRSAQESSTQDAVLTRLDAWERQIEDVTARLKAWTLEHNRGTNPRSLIVLIALVSHFWWWSPATGVATPPAPRTTLRSA